MTFKDRIRIPLSSLKHPGLLQFSQKDQQSNGHHHLFFSSSLADIALWLGPYMSINCQNYICTRTQKVHKYRQIKQHQTTPKTHNQDDPQIPQPDLRFVKKNSKPDKQRGKSPNNKTHKMDLPRDTADFPST